MGGVASVVSAPTLGWNVARAILTLMFVQGGIAVTAALLGQLLAGGS